MLQNREGQRVPDVTFRIRRNNEWASVSTADLFDGKTVAVFSLPGAFTPTCSSTHLPRFNELAPAFFANGVDAILCVSVNDAFVMNEWAKDQECANITVVPDGNAGLSPPGWACSSTGRPGLRQAFQRYSMLVKDGIVQKMFIRPRRPATRSRCPTPMRCWRT
jgi:peroxiredoxin